MESLEPCHPLLWVRQPVSGSTQAATVNASTLISSK
jgi:hypothetical protein